MLLFGPSHRPATARLKQMRPRQQTLYLPFWAGLYNLEFWRCIIALSRVLLVNKASLINYYHPAETLVV